VILEHDPETVSVQEVLFAKVMEDSTLEGFDDVGRTPI